MALHVYVEEAPGFSAFLVVEVVRYSEIEVADRGANILISKLMKILKS